MPDFSSGREALRALQIAANWMMKDWKKTPNLQALGQPQIMFCLKLIFFRVRKMIKFESTRLSRVSQSLTL